MFYLFVLLAGFSGLCHADVLVDNDNKQATYVTSQTGLQLLDTTRGTGETAQSGDVVTVHYVGKLADGTVFDSSRKRQQPFVFILGKGQVIPGWEEGVVGMQVGGVRELIIPSALAYGNQDLGVIPPNSTLYFEVELVSVTH